MTSSNEAARRNSRSRRLTADHALAVYDREHRVGSVVERDRQVSHLRHRRSSRWRIRNSSRCNAHASPGDIVIMSSIDIKTAVMHVLCHLREIRDDLIIRLAETRRRTLLSFCFPELNGIYRSRDRESLLPGTRAEIVSVMINRHRVS
jgi:hypothetical protein